MEPAAFSQAEADSVVTTGLVSYGFTGIPASTKGPRIFISATNDEGVEHELIIKHGNEALMAIDPFKDGTKTLAVELDPGDYTLVCLIDEGAKTHAQLGMQTTLTVIA